MAWTQSPDVDVILSAEEAEEAGVAVVAAVAAVAAESRRAVKRR
jgi:hypothetical protein